MIEIAESQSRYGIMKSLTDQKLKETAELMAAQDILEAETIKYEADIKTLNDDVKTRDANYQRRFQDWKSQKQLQINMLKKKQERTIISMQEEITVEEDSYEDSHTQWKTAKELTITAKEREWTSQERSFKSKVESKTAIIKEIEKGIKDLKAISKDQGE